MRDTGALETQIGMTALRRLGGGPVFVRVDDDRQRRPLGPRAVFRQRRRTQAIDQVINDFEFRQRGEGRQRRRKSCSGTVYN